MRIAVFGARGRTGRLLVEEALARGHELAALIRAPWAERVDELRVVVGDARDPVVVAATLEGAHAVISVMAIAEGTEPTTSLSDATRTIVDVMPSAEVPRIVVTANSSVFHDREVADPYAIVAAEHRRNLAMLRASGVGWTVLAPGLLTDDAPAGEVETAIDVQAQGRGVQRVVLAGLSLDALERDEWIGHVVGVGEAPRSAAVPAGSGG